MATFEDRFFAKVVMGPNGCWIWVGATGDGYAQMSVNGKTRSAHKLSYVLAKGPVPEGMQIDHLCRVRRCVNPDHLEAVTPRENSLRYTRTITHCKQGHEYTEANTRIDRLGKRALPCLCPRARPQKAGSRMTARSNDGQR